MVGQKIYIPVRYVDETKHGYEILWVYENVKDAEDKIDKEKLGDDIFSEFGFYKPEYDIIELEIK